MKAMVLAAGRGTRLGALTATRPKALVEVGGRPLLAIVLKRLQRAGVTDVIINLHHHGDQIESYLAQHSESGLRVTFSREETLLDTGGGLKHAAWFFSDGHPFLVHNVDVLSDIDLGAMLREHCSNGALATLATKARPTARPLMFDAAGQLCGRVDGDREHLVRSDARPQRRAGFCGIHVISPALLERLSETGAFSIIDAYLRLAGEGVSIRAFNADAFAWRDCGRPDDLRPLDD